MAALVRGLGIVAVADALWMVAAPRRWRRFWTTVTRALGGVRRLRWALAGLQAAIGLKLVKSAVGSRRC
jgi:hypothetical protein